MNDFSVKDSFNELFTDKRVEIIRMVIFYFTAIFVLLSLFMLLSLFGAFVLIVGMFVVYLWISSIVVQASIIFSKQDDSQLSTMAFIKPNKVVHFSLYEIILMLLISLFSNIVFAFCGNINLRQILTESTDVPLNSSGNADVVGLIIQNTTPMFYVGVISVALIILVVLPRLFFSTRLIIDKNLTFFEGTKESWLMTRKSYYKLIAVELIIILAFVFAFAITNAIPVSNQYVLKTVLALVFIITVLAKSIVSMLLSSIYLELNKPQDLD